MLKWLYILVMGVFLFFIPIKVVGQDLQPEADCINDALAQGRYKDCQLLCDAFIATHSDISIADLNFVKAIRASAIMSLGHMEEGFSQLQVIEKEMRKLLNPSSQDYIDWLTFLSSIYSSIDESRSLELLQDILDFYDEREDYTNPGYITGLLHLGFFYDSTGSDNTVAIDQIINRVFPLIEKNYGKDNDMYALALMLATNNAETQKDAKTQLRLAEIWLNLQGSNVANNAKARFLAYYKKLKALANLKQYDELHSNLLQYTTRVRQDCMDSYLQLPSNERLSALNYIQGWYFNLIPELLECCSSDILIQQAYDGLLFAKGLMQILEASQKENDAVMNQLNVTWRQVQQSLKTDEAAVEFVCRTYTKAHFVFNCYQALVIRPEYDAPHVVQIGSNYREHKSIQEQCDFFWQPLQTELAGVKTVYFSPHGQLHNLPAESFVPNALQLCEFYRLSSTRQIVSRHSNKGYDAVVYGGLLYDENVMTEETEISNQSRGAVETNFYLEGTLAEANKVVDVIKNAYKNNFKVVAYTGSDGTEASFRALSGKNLRVIHVATHGFYYNEDELLYLARMFNANNEKTISQLEDRPLSRSGLVFSGASTMDLYGAITTTQDDGLLTAQEVSELDFRGLDLIVLSACETGLGEISGDGVFGLQRGFKKAGANSILMSLWKVDDAATCMLMTEFYKNWIGEGNTKHDALELAKQAVRSHKEKGWDDPKYWAAFILLDAL